MYKHTNIGLQNIQQQQNTNIGYFKKTKKIYMRRSNKWNKKQNKYSHLEIRFSNTGRQTHINTLQYDEQQIFFIGNQSIKQQLY